MNQTNGKPEIIWKKPSVFIELSMMVLGTLATLVMIVSLSSLAKVALADLFDNSEPAKQSISEINSATGWRSQ